MFSVFDQKEIGDNSEELKMNKIEINLRDILPSKEELLKFGILMKNRDDMLVEEDYETADNQELIKEFDETCSGFGVDGDELLRSLIIARAFYLSQIELSFDDSIAENNALEIDIAEDTSSEVSGEYE